MGAADAVEHAVFEDPQQVDLHAHADLPDFVQEQGAAVGDLQPALFHLFGSDQQGVLDHAVHVHAPHLHDRLARKRQQVGDDPAGAPGFGFHQVDDKVDLVTGIVEVVVILKGLQAQSPGQENTWAGWIGIGDGDDRRLDFFLLDHGGRPFQDLRAQCAAADQSDIDDGERLSHRGIVPEFERYLAGAEGVKVSGVARG